MNVNINQIPPEGLRLEENVEAAVLDLEIDTIKFRGPLKIAARASLITNVVTVDLSVNALLYSNCSRCLKEFEMDFKKTLRLNYQVNKLEPLIDLNPDIREEIMLDYPISPLCSPNCKGLCPKCGKNLNEGNCNC